MMQHPSLLMLRFNYQLQHMNDANRSNVLIRGTESKGHCCFVLFVLSIFLRQCFLSFFIQLFISLAHLNFLTFVL